MSYINACGNEYLKMYKYEYEILLGFNRYNC